MKSINELFGMSKPAISSQMNADFQVQHLNNYEGIICTRCGYVGSLLEFTNGRCPKCGGPGVIKR